MKKNILIVIAILLAHFAEAQICCNVVSGNGRSVVSSNGNCVKAPNLPSFADCNNGGMLDSDNDGVADAEDECIHEAGPRSNNGCPELSKEEKLVLREALDGVKFKSGSAELISESNAKLDNVVMLLKKHVDFKLKISGYTDNTGSNDINTKLSDDRAHACEKYILDKGISQNRISAKGYGSANPVADNDTEEGRAKNRRVEFDLVH